MNSKNKASQIPNLMEVAVDWRWMRNDGIGRFAKGALADLDMEVSPVHPPVSLFNPLEQFWLSGHILKKEYDLFFTPSINPPLFSSIPFVFAIHDLIPLQFSEESSFRKKLYYNTILRAAVKRAERVLTVSNFSKSEIVNWTNVDPDRVVVVGNGVDGRFRPGESAYDPGFSYLLYVGNTRPHKNVGAAIRGYARSGVTDEIRLLLSGKPNQELTRVIRDCGVEERVHFAHFIPEDELPAYYRGATALVHPSLHEGFGLTVLEALASGTPVAASNATAIPEVTGEAALLFDPRDIDEIAASIRKIVYDKGLRKKLKVRGLERARQFTWDKVAHRVESVLREAAR